VRRRPILKARRFVVRWWSRYPKAGPFFWYFRTLTAARATAEHLSGDYEIARLPDGVVLEWCAKGWPA